MKKFLALFLSFVMVLGFAGCSSEGHDGQAKTPSGSSVQKGRNYQSVYEDFEESGFTNIQFEVLDDLVTGWMTKDGEVESVSVDGDAKLNIALKNAPRERQAQTMANAIVAAKKQDNPDMTKGELKKASQQALTQARASVGAKKETIKITDREWEAIQAGAISESKLIQIINNVDMDSLRQRATPRATTTLSTAKQNKIASMNASGYSTSEIAEALGISTSTVRNYLN